MSEYTFTRTSNKDTMYRIIDVTKPQDDSISFIKFQNPTEMVELKEYEVIEILQEDKEVRIETGRSRTDKKQIIVRREYGSKKISYQCPDCANWEARMWIQRDNEAVCYKVPRALDSKSRQRSIFVPAGVSDLKLIGDKYLCALVDIRNE